MRLQEKITCNPVTVIRSTMSLDKQIAGAIIRSLEGSIEFPIYYKVQDTTFNTQDLVGFKLREYDFSVAVLKEI